MGRTKLKHDEKKGIIDEYEISDIDQNEAREARRLRAKRWKEIELEEIRQRKLNKYVVDNAEKMKNPPINRPPNDVEMAWLRCDYILWKLLDSRAYNFMEHQRKYDPDAYRYLYKIFMPKEIMQWADHYVNILANDHGFIKKVPFEDVFRYYKKYKGIKHKITIKHKGEKERTL